MPQPFKWLDFKITNRCNNHCVYCGVKNDPPTVTETLSLGTIKWALEDALNAGFTFLCFLGGEPSIREDITDIIRVVSYAPDVHLRLITNLKRYRPEMYAALFDTASCDAQVVASFENFSYPNYKRVVPAESMERIEAINTLAQDYEKYFGDGRERSVALHSVISRENFRTIGAFVEYYFAKGIDVSLGLVCPSVFTDPPKAFNEFRREEIRVVICQLDDLDRAGHLNWANGVLREFLNDYAFGTFSHRTDCWAGHRQVIINTDGGVFPCIAESYLSGKKYGNIQTERFTDILGRLDGFTCSMPPTSACWDHYLWDCLGQKLDAETTPPKAEIGGEHA